MMKRQRHLAVALAVTVGLIAGSAQAQVSSDEIAALRAQLAALQERLAALEAAQQTQATQLEEVATTNADQQESIDQGADNLARALGESASSGWLARWQWRGDLRYRNENIDAEGAVGRNRDRIRGRFGVLARVNDTVRVEWQLSTAESADARSTNITLSDANSRKSVYIDLAYGEWMPNERWRLTAGKMKMPWTRVGSYFYDGDINPEGFAANWQQGSTGWFAGSFVTRLVERSANVDSEMIGAQVGFRDTTASGDRYSMAVNYQDHRAVEGHAIVQASSVGGFFGNTTKTAGCRSNFGGACLANDYDVLEWQGEWQTRVADRPLNLFANYAHNIAAKGSDPLDTAYSLGFTYGRVSSSIPSSWEFGLLYQLIEKDAMLGQWVDSDFAGGVTDASGYAIRGAYQLNPNLRLGWVWMINELQVDTSSGRDYERIMVDLNWSF
jgi:hypothetical protein